MQGVIPRPDVAPVLQERFVALAADADDPDPEVIELAQKLDDAYLLPFVIFADSEGQFLSGTWGPVDPRRFAETLGELTE